MSRILSFAALTLLTTGLSPWHFGGSSTPIDSFKGYRSWYCDTPEPVDMQFSVALSCVGPQSWDTNPANPHLPRLFKIYVNPTAKAAFLSLKPYAFPVGSIVVKEKYVGTPADAKKWTYRKVPKGAKPELLTVLIKREKGFDPANGDWEFQVVNGDVTKAETKDLERCAPCHKQVAKQDFVFQRHGRRFEGVYVPPTTSKGG